MTVSINGTSGIVNDATDLNYTGTLTGGTGVVNLGSGQVYKDASGNVGIGTSSPATLGAGYGTLDIRGSNGGGFRWGNSTNSAYSYADIDGTVISTATAKPLILSTNNTERARIDSSGNLLVGTTDSPSTLLTDGYAGVAISTSNFLVASRFNNPAAYFKRENSNGEAVFFLRDATTVGSISVTTTGTSFNTSSDYRLKEAVAPMTGALAKVALLKPCTYKWKVDGSDGQGFIAHELAEVEAGCVTGEKDAVDADGNPQYQGIDTSFLVATLAAAIQEQQTLITALTARITALEGAAV